MGGGVFRGGFLRAVPLGLAALLLLATPASGRTEQPNGVGVSSPGTSLNVQLVGHHSLFNRGENAAIAMFDHYVYVGNRTDGSNSCGDLNGSGPVAPVLTPTNADGTCTHLHPGILIVDVADPTSPTVVGEIPVEIAAPDAAGDPVGVTSRELRVWPQKKLLVELSFRCSRLLHACPRGNDTTFPFDYKFFDLKGRVVPAGTRVQDRKSTRLN